MHRTAPEIVVDTDLWDTHPKWWQDGFTDGADPEYEEQILPLAGELLSGRDRILDVGAGEGQIARLAVSGGASFVVGADPTRAQIDEAVARGGGVQYCRAAAASLPFGTASFDAVIACLVFEHIAEVDQALAEVARVLVAGGRFLLFLNHPLLQAPGSGWIEDHTVDPADQYWRIGPYLVESNHVEEVQEGVFIPFVHRPLGRYLNAMIDAGLVLERMLEPPPPAGLRLSAGQARHGVAIPRLLVLMSRRGHR
ncbi:MAG: class I SAM-dependent methyltransferase [Acidimicrobiales bacterium]